MNRNHRNTICVEDAEVLQHVAYPSDQFILRLLAPDCAGRATPGSFVHLKCDSDIPMRRPLSIMRANAQEGWIEVLYKTVGLGLSALSKTKCGDRISILGPIGTGFYPDPDRPLMVMIGGGVGIPPLVFLSEYLNDHDWKDNDWHPATSNVFDRVAFFGSEIPFPFALRESRIVSDGCPTSATATLELMDASNVACRLASNSGYPGCYPGLVTDLAREWLEPLSSKRLAEATIYACGPEPMLKAAARLAVEFGIPSQLCLEEFMACAVGGCAGCAVEIRTDAGPAMKRVCVDGPVFPGHQVYPARN